MRRDKDGFPFRAGCRGVTDGLGLEDAEGGVQLWVAEGRLVKADDDGVVRIGGRG